MSVEQARAALAQAADAFKAMQAFTRDSPGAASFEYQQSTTALYQAALAAFKQVLSQNGLAPNLGGLPAGTAQPAASGGSVNVTINIGGKATTVKVASQADSDALLALLQQLEAAMGTAA